MLKWLRLAVWLLLSAAVSGREVECDHVDGYIFRCWNSPTHDFVVCWGCTIYNQQISELEVSIAPKHRNGTDFDVELVLFSGGDLTKMPKVIHKNTEKQIFNVGLRRTNNRVLNAQFFGNGAQHLVNFQSQYNDILSVEASAFRNCAALEALGLDDNGISTISSDAFRGLHKLVWLNLDSNKLTAINENLFDDLGNLEVLNLSKNQLTEITDTAFKNLPKLKKLLLDHNKVEIVTRRMFQHNLKLQEIYLQYNQLRVIQSRSFAHLGKLSWLYLHKNKCTNNDFQDTNPEEILAALAGCLPTICLIPLIPNGYIVSAEDNAPQTVGDSSEEYKPVKVVCLPSFLLFHDKETQPNNSCVDDNWTNEKWPECYRVCHLDKISGLTILTSCDRKKKAFPCSGHLLPGTKAIIRCKIGYEEPEGVNSELTCQESGQWNLKAFQCLPICGQIKTHLISSRIFGGEDTNVTEVPWHVAIYQNSEQICGGTIVSERVVISAAHCFSRSVNRTHSFDVKDFKVIAGKTQRSILSRETLETQSRDIQEVAIPDRYDGHISYRADIATVIISGQFNYRPHISPACLQFFEYAYQKYPRSETMALVAGWGTTKELRPSEILQSFNIPVVDLRDCREEAPPFYKDRVIEDKICAGYVDSDRSYSKVVCPGDSGGGFLISQMVADNQQYFLQGVVSNSRRTLDCDREFYTLFTNVQDYKEFLSKGIEKGAAPWVEMEVVRSRIDVDRPWTFSD